MDDRDLRQAFESARKDHNGLSLKLERQLVLIEHLQDDNKKVNDLIQGNGNVGLKLQCQENHQLITGLSATVIQLGTTLKGIEERQIQEDAKDGVRDRGTGRVFQVLTTLAALSASAVAVVALVMK